MNFYNKIISILIVSMLIISHLAVAQSKSIPAGYNFFDSRKAKSQLITRLDKILTERLSVEATTDALQMFINANSEIILPDREIIVSKNGISIGDNKTLIFQKGTKLRIQANDLDNYGIINVINSKNVTIYNAVLIGDRYEHLSKKGEWGMGIRILGSENVRVDNFYIESCWGDGIYIGRKDLAISSNVYLFNGVVNNNRRNGLSVTGVNKLSIDRVTFANTNGTNPQFGLDIEPNSNLDEINNVNIGKIYSINNRGGMLIALDKLKGSKRKNVLISIDSFSDIGSQFGLNISRLSEQALNVSGRLNIKQVKVNNNLQPIIIKTFSPKDFKVQIEGFDIVNPRNKNFHNQEVMRVNKGKSNVRIQSK